MKLICAVFLSMLILQGCTTAQIEAMDSAVGWGVLTDEKDSFDGSRRVRVSPAPVAKISGAPGIQWVAGFDVGAQWQSNRPSEVLIILKLENDIESIIGFGVSLDGNIKRYDRSGSTDFDLNSGSRYKGPESTAFVPMPLEDFVEMIDSESTVFRLYTVSGYVDAQFSKSRGRGGALTAHHHLSSKLLPRLPLN